MKFVIEHQTSSYMRLRLCCGRFTKAEAEVLDYALSNLKGVSGVSIIGEAARMGAESMLRLASLISINLAVINLMPIPALDGGKLLMYAIEAIRKKPVSQKVEAGITVIGFLAIIGFAIILTVQDVARLAGG